MFEGFSFRGGAEALARIAGMFTTVVLGWYALKRYIAIMQVAERYARRSICARCKRRNEHRGRVAAHRTLGHDRLRQCR